MGNALPRKGHGMIFGSPRQALAYMFAHHRGPKASRPQYGHVPADTGRSHWDGCEVGALVYGPRALGSCGVVHGSDLDRALREWATSEYKEPTGPLYTLEKRLRCAMRAAGLLRARVKAPRVHRWTYPDGTSSTRLLGESEKSRCTSPGNVATLP